MLLRRRDLRGQIVNRIFDIYGDFVCKDCYRSPFINDTTESTNLQMHCDVLMLRLLSRTESFDF